MCNVLIIVYKVMYLSMSAFIFVFVFCASEALQTLFSWDSVLLHLVAEQGTALLTKYVNECKFSFKCFSV